MNDRRDFLKKTALLGLGGLAGSVLANQPVAALEAINETFSGADNKVTLAPLPYAYDALEPFIDKQTMEIHHDKHHQAYVDKLNTVPASEFDPSADLATSCKKVNDKTSPLLRNNLGGTYNHNLFWNSMKPNPTKKPVKPEGKLADVITTYFKTFEDFMKEFSEKATKVFGSGWCWLAMTDGNKALRIVTTANQDNPLMSLSPEHLTPILGLDVWEHAYYLKYQNKRPDYISNWWNVVNWEHATQLYTG